MSQEQSGERPRRMRVERPGGMGGACRRLAPQPSDEVDEARMAVIGRVPWLITTRSRSAAATGGVRACCASAGAAMRVRPARSIARCMGDSVGAAGLRRAAVRVSRQMAASSVNSSFPVDLNVTVSAITQRLPLARSRPI